jgi:hypothetical protein
MINLSRLCLISALACAALVSACAGATRPEAGGSPPVEAASSAERVIGTAEAAIATADLALLAAEAVGAISPGRAIVFRAILDRAGGFVGKARAAFTSGDRLRAAKLLRQASDLVAQVRAGAIAPG